MTRNKPQGNATGFQLSLTAPAGPDYWESGIEIIKSCGTAPKSLPVTIGPVAQAKLNALMQEYPRIEWLAYLLGDKDTRHISDIIIPAQEVTAVNVFVGNNGVNVPTIGVIHSHHGMGNGFSGTDHEYINQNHDISLCIAHGGIAGQVRTSTACGKYVIVKAEVLQQVEGFDNVSFIAEAKALIKPKTYAHNNDVLGFSRNSRGHQLGLDSYDDSFGDNAYNHTGLYDGEVVDMDNEDEFPSIGIIELADTFRKDVEDKPEYFAIIDMVGMKELVGESVNPAKNYDRFAAMYSNFLDSHTIYAEWPEKVFNPAIELLDELDGNFETLTIMERNHLINLWKALKDAIDLAVDAAEEAGELIKDKAKAFSPAADEDNEWDAAPSETAKPVDTEDKLPSDNLWDTIGNHNSTR
jgi:hypothetical protein